MRDHNVENNSSAILDPLTFGLSILLTRVVFLIISIIMITGLEIIVWPF